jgi:hypothetical protein
MKTGRRLTLVLAGLTVLVLALSFPGSLRDVYQRGGFYIFSQEFLVDIPERLAGPGRFRFLLQPAFAMALGIRAGRSDAREGRPAYLRALLLGGGQRTTLLRTSLEHFANLLLMGILLESLSQWAIFGESHLGAALVVGPVLIVGPYVVARTLANLGWRLNRRLP